MTYQQVVFMQGSEADPFLDLLDDEGPEVAINAPADWHTPGDHDTRSRSAAGPDDDTFLDSRGYLLAWNTRIGYIGLEYRL